MAEAVKPRREAVSRSTTRFFFERVVLLVGGHVAQLRQALQLGDEARHPQCPGRAGLAASRLY